MIVALLSLSALAADPVACDPARDLDGSRATGFCLSEDQFVAFGRIRAQLDDLTGQVAARDLEIKAFEAWKVGHADDLKATIDQVTQAGTDALARERTICDGELATARQRSPIERHGFAIGVVVGVGATVATTALVLQTYGAILGP
jgi:hypothetical protein